jgi:hypothetical protein
MVFGAGAECLGTGACPLRRKCGTACRRVTLAHANELVAGGAPRAWERRPLVYDSDTLAGQLVASVVVALKRVGSALQLQTKQANALVATLIAAAYK